MGCLYFLRLGSIFLVSLKEIPTATPLGDGLPYEFSIHLPGAPRRFFGGPAGPLSEDLAVARRASPRPLKRLLGPAPRKTARKDVVLQLLK